MRLYCLTVLCVACVNPLADNSHRVTEPRVLAVALQPAESEPGGQLSLRALYADSGGALSEGWVDWAFCAQPKPLAELGPVATDCLDAASDSLRPIGSGLQVSGLLPDDACSLFGPNPPPPQEDDSAGRPVDPDVTGGYYQPLLGFPQDNEAMPTLVSARVRCGLANVSQETYVAWNQSYQNNQNPAVAGLALDLWGDEQPLPPEGLGPAPELPPGEPVTLTAHWPECGEGEACAGAETYTVFSSGTQTLGTRREAISVSWYSTGGVFEDPRGGRSGEDLSTWSQTQWTPPDTAGEQWIAVVLRDERGGIGFESYRVLVSGQ